MFFFVCMPIYLSSAIIDHAARQRISSLTIYDRELRTLWKNIAGKQNYKHRLFVSNAKLDTYLDWKKKEKKCARKTDNKRNDTRVSKIKKKRVRTFKVRLSFENYHIHLTRPPVPKNKISRLCKEEDCYFMLVRPFFFKIMNQETVYFQRKFLKRKDCENEV